MYIHTFRTKYSIKFDYFNFINNQTTLFIITYSCIICIMYLLNFCLLFNQFYEYYIAQYNNCQISVINELNSEFA